MKFNGISLNAGTAQHQCYPYQDLNLEWNGVYAGFVCLANCQATVNC